MHACACLKVSGAAIGTPSSITVVAASVVHAFRAVVVALFAVCSTLLVLVLPLRAHLALVEAGNSRECACAARRAGVWADRGLKLPSCTLFARPAAHDATTRMVLSRGALASRSVAVIAVRKPLAICKRANSA